MVWLLLSTTTGTVLLAAGLRFAWLRLQLARAKHPSLQGHARIARRLSRLVPFYEYDEERFFRSDDAPPDVAAGRRTGFERLAAELQNRSPRTLEQSEALEPGLSDLQFTKSYPVPFQYARHVRRHLKVGSLVVESSDAVLTDLDGRAEYDLTGSYGMNVFGYDFYKECIDAGIRRVRSLGPVLGSYHPVIAENVARLRAISGLDEVSFHMSGTEAVMQAVQLSRYHTGRSHVVRFCGAYHGWWDGVQPGVGNPRVVRDAYTLKDMDERSLRVLRTRGDIACVLVNPLQALHPNAAAPSDATLINSTHRPAVDRTAYGEWLQKLRRVCTERSIVLILDEVFVGFRIAYRGAQEYFDVAADMVTYGKTLGGGLPVGVLCGRKAVMKRFNHDRPSDICFARGTFNSHPYVMASMNEFLRRLDEPMRRNAYGALDATWDQRAAALNASLKAHDLPVRVANLSSIWTVWYTTPSRYNWMFQYYLRAAGLRLSWVGSGRLVFQHDYSNDHFAAVVERVVEAARRMKDDGWWWHEPDLTNRGIARSVLREMLAIRLRGVWGSSVPSTASGLAGTDAGRLTRNGRGKALAAQEIDR